MSCLPSATYPQRSEALDVKRRLLRYRYIPVVVYLCEQCDRYHLGKAKKFRIPDKPMLVLRMVALGHSEAEISRLTNIPWRMVRHYTEELRRQFAALSNANLVATTIALGFLDPQEFVPPMAEKQHA